MLPVPGSEQSTPVRCPDGDLVVLWTAPRYKTWRQLQQLKALRDAWYVHLPDRAGEAAERLLISVVKDLRVKVRGVPSAVMEPGTWAEEIDGAVVLESCSSADVVVAMSSVVLDAGGLSDVEKKASPARLESSPQEGVQPPNGITILPSPSAESEAAEWEA